MRSTRLMRSNGSINGLRLPYRDSASKAWASSLPTTVSGFHLKISHAFLLTASPQRKRATALDCTVAHWPRAPWVARFQWRAPAPAMAQRSHSSFLSRLLYHAHEQHCSDVAARESPDPHH